MTKRLYVCALLLCALVSDARSQTATGLYPHGSFDSKGFDTINQANGNVHFSIPIFSKAGRGGMNFSYSLSYDSLIYTNTMVTYPTTTWVPSSGLGWQSDNTVPIAGNLSYSDSGTPCGYTDNDGAYQQQYQPYDTGFVYFDSNGAAHNLSGYIGGCDAGMDGTPYSTEVSNAEGY